MAYNKILKNWKSNTTMKSNKKIKKYKPKKKKKLKPVC